MKAQLITIPLRGDELRLHALSSLTTAAHWLECAGDNVGLLYGNSAAQLRDAEDFRNIASELRARHAEIKRRINSP